MNHYSLSSDSPRWWWGSALGGGLALTSVAMLGVLVATNPAAGQSDFRDGRPDQHVTTVVPMGDMPCFNRPLSWNVALDGPMPLCARPGDQQPVFGFEASSAQDASSQTAPLAHIQQIRWVEQVL
jgi:hypothetical protein